MTTAKMKDGTENYFKDWGSGPVITFSDGWPLTADAWDAQMLYFGNRGFKELAMPFFGYNRPGAKVSQGQIDSFWAQGMMGGLRAEYDCVKAFSETDFTADLAKMTVTTLLLQGEDDQIVPIDLSSRRSIKILPHGTIKAIAGAPHGLCVTHADQVSADLLAFIEG